MKMAAEKNFENRVKTFLKENGCWFVKFFANGYTKKGIPDILVCCDGRFVGVEVKAPNGKPSELQLYNLRKIHEAGGYGVLLYPKDFDLFKELICAIQDEGSFDVLSKYMKLRERWWDDANQSFQN